MKKQIAILAAVVALSVTQASAQGYFNFQNGAPGVDAPVREVNNGAFLVGAAYKADYYWAHGTVSDPNALTAGGSAQSFDTIDAGYFYGPKVVLNGETGVVTLQVRAWRASDGASWAAANATPGAHVGQGNLVQVTLGTGTLPTPNMVGIQPFNLAVVGPEPTTIALGLMGASALFIRRRKV